jgi:putative ABC transport system permease protein
MLTLRPGARARAARAAVAGTAGTAAAVFGLVTAALALAAVAMPRYDVAFRTHALEQRVAQAPPDATSLDITAHENLGTISAPGTVFDSATEQINEALAPRLPLAPTGADWYTIQTAGQPALDAPSSAVAAAPPLLLLTYRSGFVQHVHLVSGVLPGGSEDPAYNIGGVYQVALTQAVATRFGLHVGSIVHTNGSLFSLTLAVVGLVAPNDPAAAYWTEDASLLNPTFVPPGPSLDAHWDAAVYINSTDMGRVLTPGPYTANIDVTLRWVMPFALAGIDADHMGAVVAHVRAVTSEKGLAQPPGSPAAIELSELIPDSSYSSRLPDYLGPWLAAQDSIIAVLSLLLAGMATIGAVMVLVAGRLVVTRRGAELALRRARGESVRQLGLRVAAGMAAVAIPSATAGAAVGWLATPGPSTPLAWWFAGTVAAVSVVGPVGVVVGRHRGANPAGEDARERERPAGRHASLRRWIGEGSLVAVAVAGLVVLRQQGQLTQGGAIDVFPAAAPALVAIPLAVLAPYAGAMATRLAQRGARRRKGAAVFVGLAQASRPRPGTATAVFALVLALGIVSFSPMLRDAVTRGKVSATWAAVGADAVVDSSRAGGRLTPAAAKALTDASHATQSVTADVTQGTFPAALPTYVFTAGVVDPTAYAALLAGTPAPAPPSAFGERPPAGAPIPIVTSSRLAGQLGSGDVALSLSGAQQLTVRVVGTVSSSAVAPGSGDFVLVPAWAVHPVTAPNLIALRGSRLDETALKATAAKVAHGSRVTLRSAALDELPGASLQPGAYWMLTLGAAVASVFSVLILLLSLSLDARARELALTRLRCLGLDGARIRAMAFVEALPTVLAATVGGVVAAALVAPVVGPRLNLSLFTGSPASVALRPGAAQLALPAAGLLIVAAATLLTHTALTRRRGLSRALRTGDW